MNQRSYPLFPDLGLLHQKSHIEKTRLCLATYYITPNSKPKQKKTNKKKKQKKIEMCDN